MGGNSANIIHQVMNYIMVQQESFYDVESAFIKTGTMYRADNCIGEHEYTSNCGTLPISPSDQEAADDENDEGF